MTDAMPADLAAWVHAYIAQAARDDTVNTFVTHVDDAILAALPELAADPALVADLHASTRSQFVVFLSLLERETQELLLPPQAVDLALSIARRQFGLPVLLKVYRVAAAQVWDFFTATAASVPPDGPDRFVVLSYLWDHGGTWINEAVEQLIAVFHAEREAITQGTLARRTETVHALLRGDLLPLDEAATLLDHPLRGTHTAVVLWSAGGPSADTLAILSRTATALASSVRARALATPAGRGEVWCWLTARHPIDPQQLRDAFAATTADLHLAIGCPGTDLVGFRDSHREAVDAQRHALVVPADDRCTEYAAVELACLAVGNPPAARALVRRELGALAGDEPAVARIRETVLSYLDLGGSVERAAAALFIHKNTVRYRLAQAEEMLGHPLSERRTHVAVALHALPRLPPLETA